MPCVQCTCWILLSMPHAKAHLVSEVTSECCPKYKWNHLWPQSSLVWSGLEVVLVVSDPETCSVIGVPDCACFVPRSALKWVVKRIPEYVMYKIGFSALRSFTTKTPWRQGTCEHSPSRHRSIWSGQCEWCLPGRENVVFPWLHCQLDGPTVCFLSHLGCRVVCIWDWRSEHGTRPGSRQRAVCGMVPHPAHRCCQEMGAFRRWSYVWASRRRPLNSVSLLFKGHSRKSKLDFVKSDVAFAQRSRSLATELFCTIFAISFCLPCGWRGQESIWSLKWW